jgi:Asp-tRNA(Asn)/Glu-tRNA(Gln) amidotransferase A subunit family amidase
MGRRAALVAVALALAPRPAPAQRGGLAIEEATIAGIQAEMLAGRLTARRLVEHYLARIAAYDQRGPALNAIVVVNPDALARADALDAEFRRTGRLAGPLHGIPVIVKDNYDTHDLPTTAGSLALAGSVPPDDAFQVRKIREAGAIVLAKANMAEWAFTPYETVSSILPGYTRNPYALDRVTAGSSGGTAAAVAANFGEVGLGTDTGNSIRGPSAHQALVGIRSTMGLTSRDGIIPLYLDRDIGGPMARTVADAVAVLDVIAHSDPADPVTAEADARRPTAYRVFLKGDGLRGKRIGVSRQIADRRNADTAVLRVFDEALAAMRRAGAVVVDSVVIPEQDSIPQGQRWCPRFKFDLEAYLASLGPGAPVKTLDEILRSGRFHPTVRGSLQNFQSVEHPPETNPACIRARENQEKLRVGVRRAFAATRLDALVYPTWSNPPRLIGDLNTAHGDNSQDLSPHTGFPAFTVPMGWVRVRDADLPVGLQILGDAWSEPILIEIAYGFEQATRHRRPPATTPPLARSMEAR